MSDRDTIAVFDALERSRVGERMRIALTVLATGETYRDAAAAVGFADHRQLRRQAKTLGFDKVHRAQRRLRQLQGLQEQVEVLQRRMASGGDVPLSALSKVVDILHMSQERIRTHRSRYIALNVSPHRYPQMTSEEEYF